MPSTDLVELFLFAAGAAAATAVLAAWARRVGWVDAADGPDAHRKRQRRPVPVVGGAVVLAGLLVHAVGGPPRAWPAWPEALGAAPALWVVPALAVAFLVGLLDDLARGGLDWRAKLAGQATAGLVLVAPELHGGRPDVALAVAGAAVLAQNALNTFDNADGAVASLAALALLAPAPAAAAVLCGFLPANLAGGRRGARAYLGDGGTHVLGIAVVATPLAWPALALPLADLARVAWERVRARQRPWVGDRRHLAHRLQALGLPRRGVALALVAIAAPSVLGALFGATAAGLAVTGGLFALAVRATRPAAVAQG